MPHLNVQYLAACLFSTVRTGCISPTYCTLPSLLVVMTSSRRLLWTPGHSGWPSNRPRPQHEICLESSQKEENRRRGIDPVENGRISKGKSMLG